MIPDAQKWRWIIVNSSGGKDSQTALAETVRMAKAAGVDLARIVVSHQCLGNVEWPGALELAREQAEHYGLRFIVSKYRARDPKAPTALLDYVRKRGRWPDNKNRYCTSEFKRGPGGRVITQLWNEDPGPILNVMGFRSEESAARSKKPVFETNGRFSTGSREVWNWNPILHWTAEQIWRNIHESGVRYHFAYDLGMARLSCVFGVFAPQKALRIAAQHNPELFQDYLATEREIGHDFQNGRPLASLVNAPAPETEEEEPWQM